MDPSVVSSFFFLIFFSIALSDAGYGLILAAISIFFLKKSTKTKDLFWLGLWAGIFTTIAGLLTGGILGDLFRLENPFIDWKTVSLFREKLLWFDPMKEPMIFFRLVLFLGFFQIATGLALGLWINLRKKNFLAALADNLSWLLIIFSLSLLLFSSDYCVRMSLISGTKPPLDPSHQGLAFYVISFMAVIIILFSARDEKSLFFRIFLGFLKLLVLSGFFSFLGDILSYIRLMALGMVSAGIAMAINTIAFMAWNLPYLGILFTLLILVIGHIFNLGINVLGAFVHSVRLVYVEFFPKFFVGGGKKFSPLANSNKFIEIIQ
jgi:V/A-type H+-transporting ATPase subunit I